MKTRIAILFALTFFPLAQALAGTYTTTFPLNENPLSEGGKWVDGKSTGILWSDCGVTNTAGGMHYAYGLQSGIIGYDDSFACLTGTWGPTQAIDITIYCSNQLAQSAGQYEEIEFGFRGVLSNNWFSGYLVDCSLQSDTGYVESGASLAGQVFPTGWINWPGGSHSGSQYVVHNGSTIHAGITNSTITVFFDGVLVLQTTDTTGLGPASGAPLIGFYHQAAGSQTDFGISSFTATDFIEPPRPTLTIRWDGDDFHLTGIGEPNRSFTFQFTQALEPPNWQPIAIVFSDDSGLFEFVDPFPVWGGTRFYRVVSP